MANATYPIQQIHWWIWRGAKPSKRPAHYPSRQRDRGCMRVDRKAWQWRTCGWCSLPTGASDARSRKWDLHDAGIAKPPVAVRPGMSCRRKTDASVSLTTSLLQCEMQAEHIRVDAPRLDGLETRWSQYIEKSGL